MLYYKEEFSFASPSEDFLGMTHHSVPQSAKDWMLIGTVKLCEWDSSELHVIIRFIFDLKDKN